MNDDLQAAVNDPESNAWTEFHALSRAEVSQAIGMLVAQLGIEPAETVDRQDLRLAGPGAFRAAMIAYLPFVVDLTVALDTILNDTIPEAASSAIASCLASALALATIVRRTEILSMEWDFPVTVPFTMLAGAPTRARIYART